MGERGSDLSPLRLWFSRNLILVANLPDSFCSTGLLIDSPVNSFSNED